MMKPQLIALPYKNGALAVVIVAVAVLCSASMASGDRVYLSPTGTGTWNGACSGCPDAASACVPPTSQAILDAECELVLLAGDWTSTFLFLDASTPGVLNVTSEGGNLTVGANWSWGVGSSPGILNIKGLQILSDSTTAAKLLPIMGNEFNFENVESYNVRWSIMGTKATFVDSTNIFTLPADFQSGSAMLSVFGTPMNVYIESSYFSADAFLVDSGSGFNVHISGSHVNALLTRSQTLGELTIEYSTVEWPTNPDATWSFVPYGPGSSLTLHNSSFINYGPLSSNAWANTAVGMGSAEIINCTFVQVPFLANPTNLTVHSSTFTHPFASSLLVSYYAAQASFVDVIFEMTASSQTVYAALRLSTSATLQLEWRNVVFRLTTMPYQRELYLPSNVNFTSEAHLPSVFAPYSTSLTCDGCALHFKGDIFPEDDEDGSYINVDASEAHFYSISATDSAINIAATAVVYYHAVDIDLGCVAQVKGSAYGSRPFSTYLTSGKLIIDLAPQGYNSSTFPADGTTFPLFTSQQSSLQLEDFASTTFFSYELNTTSGIASFIIGIPESVPIVEAEPVPAPVTSNPSSVSAPGTSNPSPVSCGSSLSFFIPALFLGLLLL